MIKADLHLHTCYSHGCHTPFEMHAAAKNTGLSLIGFTEHSPRPAGFDYRHEYREKLSRHLPDYVREVKQLARNGAIDAESGFPEVLFGMEIDWLAGEEDFIRKACTAYDFDYLIGSVHFLEHWGFDDGDEPWKSASQEECENRYREYFKAWQAMLKSGLFQIAAHPDLIKIHSVHQFHAWLDKPEALKQIRTCLLALRDAGMAMEISSAGLRKPCAEIYPAPQIMALAAEINLPVAFASDAHRVQDVAHAFPVLEEYARSFGFDRLTIYNHGRMASLPFTAAAR